MANQQHIEWLLEGVDAWNARRRENDFRPDFSDADLVGAFMETRGLGSGRIPLASVNFEGANLEGANLGAANLEDASLRKARLGGAYLAAAILRLADLRGAKFQRTNVSVVTGSLHVKPTTYSFINLIEADLSDALVGSVTITPMGRKAVEITDISNAIGLTQVQVNGMDGDSGTILPDGIKRPEHWPDLEIPEPKLPAPPLGSAIEIKSNRYALDQGEIAPERSDLEDIFQDLKASVNDLRDLGNLSNQSPLLAKGIERFLNRIPDEFSDLEQVRFGVGLQALRLQFNGEKENLNQFASDKVGHIEAVLLYSDLIAARLPEWQTFLKEEEDDRVIIEAKVEDTEAILEHAAEAIKSDPEHFDISLFERVREYLDDKTIEGYLASKNLLLTIAHKTFTLVREFLRDTVSEQRKSVIKNLATAMNVQLGAILLELAGLLPKELHWLVAWLEFLPTVL